MYKNMIGLRQFYLGFNGHDTLTYDMDHDHNEVEKLGGEEAAP